VNNHHANEDRKSVQKKICIRTLTFLGKTMWCVFRVTRAVNIDKAHSKINHKKERKTPTYFFSLTEKKISILMPLKIDDQTKKHVSSRKKRGGKKRRIL